MYILLTLKPRTISSLLRNKIYTTALLGIDVKYALYERNNFALWKFISLLLRNIIEPKHMPNCPAYFPLLQLIKANEIGSTTTRTTMVFFKEDKLMITKAMIMNKLFLYFNALGLWRKKLTGSFCFLLIYTVHHLISKMKVYEIVAREQKLICIWIHYNQPVKTAGGHLPLTPF